MKNFIFILWLKEIAKDIIQGYERNLEFLPSKHRISKDNSSVLKDKPLQPQDTEFLSVIERSIAHDQDLKRFRSLTSSSNNRELRIAEFERVKSKPRKRRKSRTIAIDF